MNIKIPIKGNRTIGTVAIYIAYRVVVSHGWFPVNQDIDMAFMGAIVIFFKSGLENALKEQGVQPEVEKK